MLLKVAYSLDFFTNLNQTPLLVQIHFQSKYSFKPSYNTH